MYIRYVLLKISNKIENNFGEVIKEIFLNKLEFVIF